MVNASLREKVFFVAFGLDGIGAALFEGRTGDKTGTATHGKGDGEGI